VSELFHIHEPNLTFGYNQKLQDPRDGLMLFGPFSRNRLKGQVNVGIIGPERQRGYIKEYLQTIHRPVFLKILTRPGHRFPVLKLLSGCASISTT